MESNAPKNGHDIIVIGASAGGVEALAALAQGLPADLPAAVFVVLHVPAFAPSVLPAILSRKGPMPARHPSDGESIRPGHIYVAPPDHHLLVEAGRVGLSRGPTENGHRPAVDVLFRTAARAYGPRVIGVVLSGALDDGTAGLQAVKMRGGLAVVQDPEEALFSSMPRSALENVAVDQILTLAALGPALADLARTPAPAESEYPMPDRIQTESEIAEMDMAAIESRRDGTPSEFTCPDCHGSLWEVQEGELVRYRCRVGHAYSPDSLLASQVEGLEAALWIALRALEESAAMARRMGERAGQRGHVLLAVRFGQQAEDAHQRAAIIRQALAHEQAEAARGDDPSSLAP
ncbi:MAG: chemotaxis protein CheB [Armatimonadetes bacterium]|nr:chemotaxis protein CheB [Armatimonadota bacterium]